MTEMTAERDYAALMEEAAELISEWGAYADSYFQEKYDLRGDIDRFNRLASEIRMEGIVMRFEIYDGINDELDKNLSINEVKDILDLDKLNFIKVSHLKIIETLDLYDNGDFEITRIS